MSKYQLSDDQSKTLDDISTRAEIFQSPIQSPRRSQSPQQLFRSPHPPQLNDKENSEEYLTAAELMFYLSMTFEGNGYYDYIRWLSNKINQPRSIHECLIHVEPSKSFKIEGITDNVFKDFTTKLFESKDKSLISDFHKYEQPSKGYQPEMTKILKASDLEQRYIINAILVYQLDKLFYRKIYEDSKMIDNITDYEFYTAEFETYKGLINQMNEIYWPSFNHDPFVIIERKNVIFETGIINKINATLSNKKIMNEVYDVIGKLNYKQVN